MKTKAEIRLDYQIRRKLAERYEVYGELEEVGTTVVLRIPAIEGGSYWECSHEVTEQDNEVVKSILNRQGIELS